MASHPVDMEVGISTPPPPEAGDSRMPIADLLFRWQETGSHAVFESLIAVVLSDLTRISAGVLRHRHVHDPDAVDEAVALVLDHLRRLSGEVTAERSVTKFSLARCRASGAGVDTGMDYLRMVASNRAIDVARQRRRGGDLVYSPFGGDPPRAHERSTTDQDRGRARAALCDDILTAAERLEPRQRSIVELLMQGKSQATIAHVLGVNEGTVSRLRSRAIDALRRVLHGG